jgi:serine-type D-Ala-D-Ala carboxypeptidase (penicillin-binding protein 5/6)
VRRLVLLGIGALGAGAIFGLASLSPSSPAVSTGLASPTPTAQLVVASAFLVNSVPAIEPASTATSAPPSAIPSPTDVPATPTAVPPTASPTPAGPVKTGGAPAPSVNAWSVAVLDEESGALLYGRDPHRHLAPASLTKIFTALVALKSTEDIHKPITVQFDSTELVDSTLMGIKTGETYTMEGLLYGLMLPSGNDAALAIANAIAGSEDKFAAMMNVEASQLGLTDSHFVDAHGLDRTGHFSSAYDLAMAAREGMLHSEEFRTLARTQAWEVHGTRSFWVGNLNRFLRSYDGADGVKIGYTDASGPAIVASATRNGHRVLVVLMHCGDIVGDSTPLFNWVFANFTWPAAAAAPTVAPTAAGHA